MQPPGQWPHSGPWPPPSPGLRFIPGSGLWAAIAKTAADKVLCIGEMTWTLVMNAPQGQRWHSLRHNLVPMTLTHWALEVPSQLFMFTTIAPNLQVRPGPGARDAFEGRAPQRRHRRRLDRRLGAVAKAVGGGYCRLQMPLKLAFAVREAVAGHRLGALEREGGG